MNIVTYTNYFVQGLNYYVENLDRIIYGQIKERTLRWSIDEMQTQPGYYHLKVSELTFTGYRIQFCIIDNKHGL